MAWNLPGDNGDKDKDPWGQRKRAASHPSDIDQLLRNIKKKLNGLFGKSAANGPGRGIGLIVMVAIGLWLAMGFYTVQQGERAVVLRFGAMNKVVDKGLRWRLPYPIERVEIVDVERRRQLSIGYRTSERTGVKSKEMHEALMLTGDENIVDVEFNVQYQVTDAVAFLFNVNEPEATIRQATESAVREIIGRSELDFVLTEGRQKIDTAARELLQKIIDRYQLGVTIVAVNMLPAQPPQEVRGAFEDVNRAREDLERQKNEAKAYANDLIPRARGSASRIVQEAEAYKAATIARAEGDARRFSQVAKEYAKAPAVTRQRLYLETMEQVFSNTSKILVDQKGGGSMIYLPLDKLISGADQAAAPQPAPVSPTESAPPARETGRGRIEERRRGAQP